MTPRLVISASFLLAACAGSVDWSQTGIPPDQQRLNSADVVACDKQATAAAAIYPNANASAGTPEWRAAMRRKMGMFDACMRDKGWLKAPVVGWQKTGTVKDELPSDYRGGE